MTLKLNSRLGKNMLMAHEIIKYLKNKSIEEIRGYIIIGYPTSYRMEENLRYDNKRKEIITEYPDTKTTVRETYKEFLTNMTSVFHVEKIKKRETKNA